MKIPWEVRWDHEETFGGEVGREGRCTHCGVALELVYFLDHHKPLNMLTA